MAAIGPLTALFESVDPENEAVTDKWDLDGPCRQNYPRWVPSIQETIPEHVAEAAEAARAWFSADQETEFKLTGIVDPPESSDGPLQLILCGNQAGQEVCLRERFEIYRTETGFDVAHNEEAPPEFGSVAPRLDPPAGRRAGWIDEVRARHDFTVFLFYRGFW